MDSGKDDMFDYIEEEENNSVMTISPGNTEYYNPKCAPELKPYEGKCFQNIDEAVAFYKNYATMCGFIARESTNTKAEDNPDLTIWKYLVCNRAGYKNVVRKVETEHNMEGSSKKKPRKTVSNRCGCNARLTLRYAGSDGYVVKKFEERHTHPMIQESARHFAKSNRKVSNFQMDFIINCMRSNVGLSCSYKVYKELVGSYSKIGATLVDFKNFKRDLNTFMVGCDAQMIIDDFYKKKQVCGAFHFDYEVDEEQKLCRLFWCDPINRKSFSYFGDVVSADATYKMNRYNMVFVPFTGVDNHKKSITFAAGLLLKEDVDSYVWLFDKFKKAMGNQPYVFLTDQDRAVKIAVEIVFDKSVHRFCMWHIMYKVPRKITTENNSEFVKKFGSIVWSKELTTQEFEEAWFSIITEFKQEDNPWLPVLFELRHYWIPSFFHDVPMGGLLRTTSRSESQNSFFGHFIGQNSTLVEFMMQFNSAIDNQRHKQQKLDLDSSTCFPTLKTPLDLEKHCSSVYTISVFYELQEQICESLYECVLEDLRKEDDVHYSHVRCSKNKKICVVQHSTKTDDLQCSCKKFLTVGLPCSHLFYVFKNIGVKKLPSRFINTRWTKNAILKPIFEIDGSVYAASTVADEKNVLLMELFSEMHGCINVVHENVDMMKELLHVMQEQKAKYSTMIDGSKQTESESRKSAFERFVGERPNVIDVLPPPQAKNKGREKHRIRGGKEAGMKKYLTETRTCQICFQIGHNKRTCSRNLRENENSDNI